MELEKVKQLVEYLEDRIVNNFETHFSYLVMEDFYEGGYNERTEDEFFYEEYFEQYENGVINLLLEIEDEMAIEFMNLKIRLIKLKRIIDTKLVNISNEEEPTEIKKSLRHSIASYFLIKDRYDKKEFVSLLHSILTSKSYIESSLNDFEKLFEETGIKEKILWKGTELEITYLISSLLRFFDNSTGKRYFKLIENSFKNKSGNDFNSRQLSSVYYDKSDKIVSTDSIYKVVSEISTHFSLI